MVFVAVILTKMTNAYSTVNISGNHFYFEISLEGHLKCFSKRIEGFCVYP